MKVIKNNCNTVEEKKKTHQAFCQYCDSVIEFDQDELEIGTYGLYEKHFKCPCCNRDAFYDDFDDGIDLNKDNLNFPQHYFAFGQGEGAVDIPNETINEWVRKCINSLDKNKDLNFTYTGTGNTKVIVERFFDDNEERYDIMVCKNYYEVDILKENNDF